MHLNEREVARFYSIWFPLLHFVNQHRKVGTTFPKEWRNAGVSPEVAVPVRDALWEDDALRKAFITENPAGLSQDDLALQEHSGNLAVFAGESMVKKTPSGMLLDLTKADIEAYRDLQKGDVNFVSFKRFVWFLRDTGRMDWDVAERLLKYLKRG